MSSTSIFASLLGARRKPQGRYEVEFPGDEAPEELELTLALQGPGRSLEEFEAKLKKFLADEFFRMVCDHVFSGRWCVAPCGCGKHLVIIDPKTGKYKVLEVQANLIKSLIDEINGKDPDRVIKEEQAKEIRDRFKLPKD